MTWLIKPGKTNTERILPARLACRFNTPGADELPLQTGRQGRRVLRERCIDPSMSAPSKKFAFAAYVPVPWCVSESG
jgi:hypothetical protein